MKRYLLVLSLLCATAPVFSKNRPDIIGQAEDVIERIYTYLDGCTPFVLVNSKGDIVCPEKADAGTSFKKGDFYINCYEWGVTYSGMMLASDVLGKRKYADYAYKRLSALGKVFPYVKAMYSKNPDCRLSRMVAPHFIDDCGSMDAAMAKAMLRAPEKSNDFRELYDRWFNFTMYEEYRLKDGILARHRPAENSVWLDDMYMGITPIAFRGAVAAAEGDTLAHICFNEAVKQILLFKDYLWLPEKNIYRHGWIEGMSEHPDYHWARCNGWAMLTMCDVLDVIPEDTPGRAEVLELLRSLIRGVSYYQAPDGRWHQLLDHTETYLETSATAMFTYCIAHAVNKGWIDYTAYRDIALSGWSGIVPQVNDKGQVENTCVGTGLGWTNVFYANRPANALAPHGYGPVLLAAAEIIELERKMKK